MRLAVVRESPTEEGSISIDSLLSGVVKKEDLDAVIAMLERWINPIQERLEAKDKTLETIDKLVTQYEELKLHNISSHPNIEKSNAPTGTLYFDPINNRLRLRTLNTWETIGQWQK